MLSGTEGLLTKTPQNVVVLRGEDAILHCSADSSSSTEPNRIAWKYDNDIIIHEPCTAPIPGFVITSTSATDCNIRASASHEDGISGVYRCEDQRSRPSPETRAVATVIVVGEVYQSLSLQGLAK